MFKKRRLFSVLLPLSVFYILTTVFIVVKVIRAHRQIDHNTKAINLVESLKKKAKAIHSDVDFFAPEAMNERMLKLSNMFLTQAIELKLNPIKVNLSELSNLANTNVSGNKTQTMQKLLLVTAADCESILNTKLIVSHSIASELSYYTYTLILLLILACSFAVISTFSALQMADNKSKLNALRKVQSLFLNTSIDAVVASDRQGKIVEFNQAAEKEFGYNSREIMAKNVRMLYHKPEEAMKVREALNENNLFDGEILNRRKNGEVFLSKLKASGLYDDSGYLIGTMGVSRNIVEQKNMAVNFNAIIHNIADIVYTCDVNGYFTFVNQTVVEILGYSEEELIGQLFLKIIAPDHQARLMESYKNQMRLHQEVSYLEFQVVKKDGSLIWIGQNVRMLFSTAQKRDVIGFTGIARDLGMLHNTKTT